MGLGGVKKSENSLTSLQNSLVDSQNTQLDFQTQLSAIGGKMQQKAANQQADDLNAQADVAVMQSAQQAALQQRSVDITAGNQMEAYASGGVEQQGTPLAMVNETRAIGDIQVQSIKQQGALQAQLLRSQAGQAQQVGLSDLLSSQAQGTINSGQKILNQGQQLINKQQNTVTQAIQSQQAAAGWLGMGISAGTGLLSAGIGKL